MYTTILYSGEMKCLEPESFSTPPKTSVIAKLYGEIIKKLFTNKNAMFSPCTFVNKKKFVYV
jgi:hypothetical protein